MKYGKTGYRYVDEHKECTANDPPGREDIMPKIIPQRIRDNGAVCHWCKQEQDEKVPALWRAEHGFIEFNNIACTMHAHFINDGGVGVENEHLTEADFQTWMRL